MDDIYSTGYWKDQVLPGWIVGTAGAVRYRLPPGVPVGTIARTDVYGYLLGTVMSDGTVQFDFQETGLEDLRLANAGKTADSLVRWCYSENSDQRIPAPGSLRRRRALSAVAATIRRRLKPALPLLRLSYNQGCLYSSESAKKYDSKAPSLAVIWGASIGLALLLVIPAISQTPRPAGLEAGCRSTQNAKPSPSR